MRMYVTRSGGHGKGTVRPSVIDSPGLTRVADMMRLPLT